MMGKRRRSVALIESDSDDDSNSGADIDAVITNPVFRCLVGNRNRNLSVNVIKCYLKAGSNWQAQVTLGSIGDPAPKCIQEPLVVKDGMEDPKTPSWCTAFVYVAVVHCREISTG